MVEWKKLGEIAGRNKGIPITAGQMSELASSDGNVRVFAAGSTIADIEESKLPKNCAHKLPSIIVKSRGYIEFEFYEKPFTHKNEMWSYSFDNKQEGKFIYYFLTTQTDFFRNKAKANSVKLPQLCVADTDNFLIPIPSLSEQQRIVGILDTFTASIDNLKAQITQRRKQYEYYRDQLFSVDAFFRKIGELTKVFSCPRVFRDQWQDSGVPFWRSSDIMSYHNGIKNPRGKAFISYALYEELTGKSDKIQEGDILITGGGSIGIPYLKRDNTPLFVKDADLICIKKCSSLHPTFLYHYFFSSDFRMYLNKITHDATIAHYTIGQIQNTPIPVPSLQEQQRIVSILDTFESSIQNLEAQLKEREKQYEYYRNKLLTFE